MQLEMGRNGTVVRLPSLGFYGPRFMLECKQTFSYNLARLFLGFVPSSFR